MLRAVAEFTGFFSVPRASSYRSTKENYVTF